MSELLHETNLSSQFGEAWPPEMREAFVRDLINTLHEVAAGEMRERYTPLPMLFEPNIDLAYTLTDAKDSGTVALGSGRRISYHRGEFDGEDLELAMRFSEDETRPTAFGVRRKLDGARKYPHVPAAQMGRADIDEFVEGTLVDIGHIDTTDESYRMAA